ncbi:hypothetical protein C8Q77DRAFT_730525 [Trametes polyzona]|nr:hypothetical protein C8Q77DRAFT_730525 [Trametes polyzona]
MSQSTSNRTGPEGLPTSGMLAAAMLLIPDAVLSAPDPPEVVALSDTIRNSIPYYDGAPHGHYIVTDGVKRFLFTFLEGDDIKEAWATAKAHFDAQTLSPVEPTESQGDAQAPLDVAASSPRLVGQHGASAASGIVRALSSVVLSAGPSHQVGSSLMTPSRMGRKLAKPRPKQPTTQPAMQSPTATGSHLPTSRGLTAEQSIAGMQAPERNSVMPIEPRDNSYAGIFYCAIVTLDPLKHPECFTQKYWLPADTVHRGARNMVLLGWPPVHPGMGGSAHCGPIGR